MSEIMQTDRYEGIEDLKKLPTEFEAWQAGEGIPIHKTFHVEDLKTVELAPRPIERRHIENDARAVAQSETDIEA